VDAKYHSKLIGRCGIGVNALKEKYKVLIDFSRKGSSYPDNVCIRGQEDSVHAASCEILALVGELVSSLPPIGC